MTLWGRRGRRPGRVRTLTDVTMPPVEPNQQADLAVEKQRALSWIAQHANDLRCPVCKGTSWGYGPVIELRPLARPGFSPPSSNVFPAFQYICATCGHILLFNAVIAGVLPLPGGRYYNEEFPAPGPSNG